MGTMDGIINTVSADHSLMPLLLLLKTHGKLIMVGLPEKPLSLPVFPLVGGKFTRSHLHLDMMQNYWFLLFYLMRF